MKKQNSLFAWLANTPPMLLLALFMLLNPVNLNAIVTAEWGDWGTSVVNFPDNTSSTIYGDINITITSDFANQSAYLGGPNAWDAHDCYWVSGNIDISLSEGVISGVSASVWDNNEGKSVQIQFCSSTTYNPDYNIESPFTFSWWGQYDANLSSVTSVPDGAKSARISSTNGGGWLYRLKVSAQSDECPKLTASFSTGTGSGTAPDNIEKCEGASFTMPGKGSMTKAGYALIGWKKDNAGDLIAVGQNYTMPAGGASFTAQWEEIPAVSMPADSVKVHGTDFEVSWVIPGICDLRKATTASGKSDQYGGSNITAEGEYYNSADSTVTAAGNSGSYGQYGVAFPIPSTSNVQAITVDWKCASDFSSKGVNLWTGIIANDQKTYWECNEFKRPTTWTKETYIINTKYWTDCPGNNYDNPASTTIQYIGVFANAGFGGASNLSFSVREARYHVAGRPDIDHVVLMRTKANSDPALTDTTETSVTKRVYSGIKSYYYDEDEKEEGTTYYYTIFAVHADGTLSSRTVVGKSTAEAEKFAVTYDVNGASGNDVPASASYTAGRTFTLPLQGDLHKSGHKFGGWNDGSTTTAAGASYTMPDPGAPVSFTAVWNEFSVPTVTNLAVGEAVDKEVPLSWSIPGICDLSSAVNASGISEKAAQSNGYNNPSINYNSETNIVTAAGAAPHQWQYGAVFPIPTTSGIESITIDCQGTLPDGVNLWGGVIANEGVTYWHYDAYLHNYRPSTWDKRTFTLSQRYWNDGAYSTSTNIQYLGVFANAGNGNTDNISFSVREARYHKAGQEDIDHVIVVRKAGSAPANPTDGTVYNVGTKSHFLDNDDTKEFGQTYYYSVYAVHADGTLSEATTTSHTVVATATCEVSFNIGEGAIGDAPTSVVKPANGTVTLPSIGTVYKPFYAFTGWKKNNAGDLLAAGATYTVTADDVTAENISFTAQWTEDNTTLRIPADASLYWENKTGGSNDTKDFNNEKCVDLYTTHNVEWLAYITPGYYDISMMYGAPYYGIRGTFSIIDPSGVESDRVFYTQTDETNYGNSITKSIDIMKYDLTGLKKGKLYKIKVEHDWGGSYLCIGHINFTPHTPINIASETVLDANNTVTTGLTTATDVDFPGDNDESINLYNKQMDWVVKIAKGYYNISLLYGAPEYSTRVSVALIDPEGVEPTRWFCPDRADRNGHYHYTSGSQDNQYYSIGSGKYNLNNIDPEKTYIVRVHDEYGGSNQLRVKNLTFTLLEPIEIENEVVLNAANSITPNIAMATSVDFTGDSNPDEAMNLRKGGSSPGTNPVEWEVTIARGIYNLALEFGTYSGSGNSLRAKVELIDPSGVESDKVLMTKYVSSSNFSSNQYVEIALGACAFTSVIEDKKYIIRVSDNSDPGSYCSLLVRSLTFTPVAPVEIPSVTRLDATNVFDAPGIVDSRIDIKNRQEAVWYANMTPYVYDINLHYTVASGGTKVRFGIIDVESGDTAFVHQQNKYDPGTYTISVPGQDLRSAVTAGKMYKIIVKDNYADNGSVPQIDYLEFVRSTNIETRSGLRVGDFGTICLPYGVAAADRVDAELFEIEEWSANGTSLTLSELNSDEDMVAGRPYIYQATASTATFRYYPEGDPAEVLDPEDCNGLTGSYTKEIIEQSPDNFIIYNNKLYPVNNLAYVGANKAYIHRITNTTPSQVSRRRVTLTLYGEQVVTGIDQINNQSEIINQKLLINGQLIIIRDGKTYNALGQPVNQ